MAARKADPPGTHLTPIHQRQNMVEWWYMWRNVSCSHFFRATRKRVSDISTSREK